MERSLQLVIGQSNYDKIPETVAKRVEKVLHEANSKVADLKGRFNESQKTIEKLRKDLQATSTERENLQKLLSSSESSVTELNQQLDTANNNLSELHKLIKSEEQQNEEWRKKRDDLVEENNELKDISGKKDVLISHLKAEQASCEQRFESEMFKNEDSKKSIVEMTHQRQVMLDNEEKLKKQIEQLKNEVSQLAVKCNEQAAELMSANQDKASAVEQLEKDLRQKTEELSAANFTILQLTESTQLSSSQRDGESTQLKIQFNESAAMIEHYKRELDAKIKLVDLYKANVDESEAQTAELRTEVTNLNRIVKETTEKSAMLASNIKDLQDQHQAQLTEMSATIEKLNGELRAADDRLKSAETERVENVLEKLFPRAATSNRMLKDNATLTEIFSRYNDSVSDVHRLEVECLHLNTQLECLTIKLQDTTSEFERQQVEYKKILKQKEEMTEQVDAVVAEQENLREKLKENSQRLANAESENVQLKCTQKDLARQICNLLNKVETGDGNEPTSDQLQFKRLGLSNEAIRKELITFDNIVELQENNQKLMLKIRELSSKVQKLEEQNIKLQSCEQKISYLERQVSDGETARLANEDLLTMITKQKERFKQLYFDAMNYMGKQTPTEEEVVDNASLSGPQSSAAVLDVKLKLQETVKELNALKEEHNEYREQATINFDMLKQECESAERRVSELISENSKLRSQDNFVNEQMKSLRNEIATHKKQIQVLEERNQIYDKTIAKQEVANNQLRREYWNTVMQISKAENRCSYLELECRRLLDENKNLDIENGVLHRQKMTQSILESSCELAKIKSERSDFESRVQLEKQLEDHIRQCDVLKRKLDAEQIRFKEENESIKRERDTVKNKLSDECTVAHNLRLKLSECRGQIETKDQHIVSLRKKLQEAMTTANSAACLSKKARSLKELEIELSNRTAEVEKLNSERQEMVSKSKLFDKLKTNWEAERDGLRSDLDACKLSESNSREHITELQREIQSLTTKSASVELENMKADNKAAAEKIAQNDTEIEELRRQCQRLKENLQIAERNYADVHSAHSSDVQRITALRTELGNCQEQMQQMKLDKENAVELKNQTQMQLEATIKKLVDDLQELERKVEILETQNTELVDLLQNAKPATDDTVNESDANSSIMNRTLTAEEFEEFSSEKLFAVVKYLRREKQMATTHMDALAIENTRLAAELNMQKNKVNELSDRLNSDSLTPLNSNAAMVAELEQFRRVAATLSSVTDTNVHLRRHNVNLCHEVEDLKKEIVRLKETLTQLEKENCEISKSKAQTEHRNKMLKIKEEHQERDLKQLAAEKQNQQQVNEELNSMRAELASEKEKRRQATEEVNLMKADKSRLQQEIESKSKHLQTLDDIRKELLQNNRKLDEELKELKAQIEAKSPTILRLRADNENIANTETIPESLKKDHVTSTETVQPAATTSLRKQPSGLKRSRDADTKVKSSVEKISPNAKRTRLQRGRESVASSSNVDGNINETVEDGVALLPGAQQLIVNGNRLETGNGESSTPVGDDGISEVESIDSGRVSTDLGTDLNVDPEDFQLGRIRRSSSRTEARRGRNRLNK